MRLIRKKIYRAFPELDRFSDEQCQRFVRSANSSWVRRIGRWVVVGVGTIVMLVAAVAGVVGLAEVLDQKGVFGGTIGYLGWGVLLITGTGTALVGGLVLRDWILRRRVRQLIARCGACPSCRYSLLGMRVGESLIVICPECGRELKVDPAMEELETDETGAPVYRPRVARDDAATIAARKRRHRRFIKWSAIGAATFVLLLATGYGVWWWWLVEQAKTATAERRTRQTITGLREAMWTRGPETESAREFCRFVELLQAVKDRVAKRDKLPEYSSPEGKFVGFTADVLLPNFDVATFERRSGAGTYEPTKRYVLDILKECREDGTFDQLREILRMRAPIRELDTDWKSPFFGVLLPDLGTARSMARVNGARMILAFYAGDRAEYVDALEENLAAAQILERQGLLIDNLVGIAIRSLVYSRVAEHRAEYPSEEWTREVLEAIVRRSESPGMWRSTQIEGVAALDTVQWFFAHPDKVQRARLGLGSSDLFVGTGFAGGSCGGYEGNKAALASRIDPWVTYLKQDPWKRAAMPPSTSTGYVIVDTMLPAMSKATGAELQMMRERNLCVATLAADRHRWATGLYPTSVHQLWPYVAKSELLIDPTCGLPYRVGFVQEEGQPTPVFEVMHGNDDRPAKPQPPAPKPAPARPAQPKKK